jgi:hypothetical protein
VNTKQIQKFVMRYLDATECHIIEKHPAFVTVKLSPEADKSLTNRPYYWGFVERTGAAPETMSFKFVFDPEKLRLEENNAGAAAQSQNSPAAGGAPAGTLGPGQPDADNDSILGRYFSIVVPPPLSGPGRIQKDEVTYGSRRLEQLFQVVKTGGRFVQMFEEPGPASRGPSSLAYTSWLGVNFKVEFLCDMKRDELHSLGVDLTTGQLATRFHDMLMEKKLSPRFPVNSHIPRPQITITRGRSIIEQYLEKLLKQMDHSWANSAHERLIDEVDRVDGYYSELLECSEEEKKAGVSAQWESRKQEMEWQYRPRIQVTAINCGIFHLRDAEPARFDERR